jgi:hypothetical protein
VLDLVLEHAEIHLGIAVHRRVGILGMDPGRLLLDRRRLRRGVAGLRVSCRQRPERQAGDGDHSAGYGRQGTAEPPALAIHRSQALLQAAADSDADITTPGCPESANWGYGRQASDTV